MRLSVCLFARLISIKIIFAFSMSMPQKSGTKCEQVAWLVTLHSIGIKHSQKEIIVKQSI